MRRLWVAAATLAALVAACGERAPETAMPAPIATATVGGTPSATMLPPSTPTIRPPTVTPVPADTATPTITPTPAPVLRQLTSGGCCVQPVWSPDGSEIWYIDRPSPTDPSGLWAVPAEGGPARFVTDRLGIRSPDGRYLAYPESGATYIEAADGERWVAPSSGRPVSFSPDSTRIAWQIAYSTVNFDRRQVEIKIANVDGTEAQTVATLAGGGLADWFPDGQRLLISGRDEADRQDYYAVYDLASGSLTPVVEAAELRGALLSPTGDWLAYQVTFSGDPQADGLWIQPVSGGEARRAEVYGAYRWRDANSLLVIPLELGAAAQRLLSIDAATGVVRNLTDPAATPLRIAGGDWALAPDGRRLVFVSAEDRNLWILELTE